MEASVERLYLEAVVHSLAKPDVLLLLHVLAEVPGLLGDLALSGTHAGLSCVHVAEDLDGILSAALVGVNPVLAWRTQKTDVRADPRTPNVIDSP